MMQDTIGLSEVRALSENELRFTYATPTEFSVSLIYNPVTQELADAKVRVNANPLMTCSH